MIEIPEGLALAEQLNKTVQGKRIARVEVLRSPHKFAWFQGDPLAYPDLLAGQTVGRRAVLAARWNSKPAARVWRSPKAPPGSIHADQADVPAKHQLLLEFEDGSALSLSVRMYGGILCFRLAEAENEYYLLAEKGLPPLSAGHSIGRYFEGLAAPVEPAKLSLKAFLATEQRIPGLGNGCLQDILYNARLNPKRKLGQISAEDLRRLVPGSSRIPWRTWLPAAGATPSRISSASRAATKRAAARTPWIRPAAIAAHPSSSRPTWAAACISVPTCQPLS